MQRERRRTSYGSPPLVIQRNRFSASRALRAGAGLAVELDVAASQNATAVVDAIIQRDIERISVSWLAIVLDFHDVVDRGAICPLALTHDRAQVARRGCRILIRDNGRSLDFQVSGLVQVCKMSPPQTVLVSTSDGELLPRLRRCARA